MLKVMSADGYPNSALLFATQPDSIGSPSNQTAEDYYLVRSNPIYGHFRWVLARNMLHMADLAFYIESHKGTTEPQEILEASSFEACDLADKSLLTASK
ncbi:hypothetical protein LRP52_42015 [Photobacterium sp. ZSDE20]|uniref:Uncharacterized protein n=1 Tax=Photobacterium pectinilyticum TaxID=2906793 RepID=A0ABT1N9R8_9GAMM|nr:hypothetical protein [Photobacterium sp. ZSDE20]MCQ1060882.1 hypothetical protein [Photobacterium sp. ZSDE20]MDD1828750.1 hypothetical protein [Photobacterium sp. ZSDE20]